LFVLIKIIKTGWWLARINGKEGWVPSNYLEEYIEEKPAPPPPARNKRLPPAIPSEKTQQQQLPQQQPTNNDNAILNRMSQHSDAVPVMMPGIGGTADTSGGGVPAWRVALEARKAANAAAAATQKAAPPIPSKPSVSAVRNNNAGAPPVLPTRPLDSADTGGESSSSLQAPPPVISTRLSGATSPHAPPRNGNPAALSLADAVSKVHMSSMTKCLMIKYYFILIDRLNLEDKLQSRMTMMTRIGR
jgi:myosin-1